MPIVIHHPVRTVDNGFTNWVNPAWADHGLLQAYRVDGFEEPDGDAPSGGATLYQVHEDNLDKALSDGATLLADNLTDNSLNKVGRSAIEAYWGKKTPEDVASPADAIIRIVGRDAHPDGVLGPKPLMPGSDGRFRWVFAIIKDPKPNLSIAELPQLVTPQKFNPALDRDSSHFASRSHVRDVQLAGVREAMQLNPLHGRKLAGFNAVKWGVPQNAVGDYAREFMPVEFRDEKPLPPETRYDVNFNVANTSTITGWTEVAGDWEIVSNMLETVTPGVQVTAYIRYDSALSGADHYNKVDITWESATLSSFTGPAARCHASAFEFYAMVASNVSAADGLFRWLNSTTTSTLVSVSYTPGAGPLTSLIKCDGSIIYGEIGTGYTLAFTDGNITGTQVGIVAVAQTSGNNHKFDNLTAEDFSGGVPVARLINGGRVAV